MPAHSPTNATQYFLGIAGKQIGPLNEAEVLRRIKTGSLNHETLIWHEGMEAWGPITSLANFDAALKTFESTKAEVSNPRPKSEPQKVSENVKKSKGPAKAAHEESNQFLGDDKSVSIVFSESEGRLGDQSFVTDRIVKVLAGLVTLIVLVSGYFFVQSYLAESRGEALRAKGAPSIGDSRQTQLGKATSELLLDPQNSEATLLNLIRSNSIDAVAQEATKTLEEHYSRNQKFVEAGRLMMLMKKPSEAAAYFIKSPNGKTEAETAFFEAYQAAKEPEVKKSYLLEDIKILLTMDGRTPTAVERIRQFEQEFPGVPHPYAYYLKTVDDKISDIFSRISFHFVQGLMAYIEAELPQINLMDRPLVEVKRDKNNLYKVVGTYKGEILLNKDRLEKIQFLFWLNGDRWSLVDTNLTRERKKWAEQERLKLKDVGISGDQMVKNLENTFHTKFPNAALHEKDLLRSPTEAQKKNDF